MKIILTERQEKILKLISEGYTSQQIGEKLFSSKRTIEGIRENLFALTNTKNTAHLVAYGFRNGLLSL